MLVIKKRSWTKTLLLFAFFASIFFAVFFIFNSSVLAQFGEENISAVNLPKIELIRSIINIINYILGFLALIAVIIVIYAGFLWMTAGGDLKKVDKARKYLINGAIGLVIILAAGAITLYVFNVLGDKLGNGDGDGGYGKPCAPANTCTGCNIFCNADGKTEYNPIDCGLPSLCGILPENVFKINSIVTDCGNSAQTNTDVYLCSAIIINFNNFIEQESVKTAVENNTLKIEDCSNSSCENVFVPDFYPANFVSGKPTGIGSEWKVNGRSIVFYHQNLFASNHNYRLIVPKTIKNKQGDLIDSESGCGTNLAPVPGCVNAAQNFQWVFMTGETSDKTAPQIISSYPVQPTQSGYPDKNVSTRPVLRVNFSEAIDPATLNANNIKVKKVTGNVDNNGNGGAVSLTNENYSLSLNSNGKSFDIYDLVLEPFQWYEISVTGIKDLCQNLMVGEKKWRFATNDQIPKVTFVYPKDGSKNACPNTAVYAVFNTSMYNPETESCLVTQNGQGGGLVTAGSLTPAGHSRILQVVDDYTDLSLNPNNFCKHYEFLPSSNSLAANSDYTAEIRTNLVINANGDKLEKRWSFKVVAEDVCNHEKITCGSDIQNCPLNNNLCPNDYICTQSGNACKCSSISDDYSVLRVFNALCKIENNNIISYPSPNPQNANQNVCRNAVISAEFNKKIEDSSVSGNVLVLECGSIPNGSNCASNSVIGQISVFSVDNQKEGLRFVPSSLLKQNQYYQVILKKNEIGRPGIRAEDNSTLQNDYSWYFKTQNSSESCALKSVDVRPNSYSTRHPGDVVDYQALSLAENCQEIANNYVWQWQSSNVNIASVSANPSNSSKAAAIVSSGQLSGFTQISALALGKSDYGTLNYNPDSCSSDIDCEDYYGDGSYLCPNSTCDVITKKCTPVINSLSPNSGPVGRYVTVSGCYFENSKGNGRFMFGDVEARYPCNTHWDDQEIIAEVPANAGLKTQVITKHNLVSNRNKFFTLTTECASGVAVPPGGVPGICSLNPIQGKVNTTVNIKGVNFMNSASEPSFFKNNLFFNSALAAVGNNQVAPPAGSEVTFNSIKATNFTNWSPTSITTYVPNNSTSGLVIVNVNSCPSNGLYFNVLGNSCDNDNSFAGCQVNNNLCGYGLICNESSCTCQLPEPPEPPAAPLIKSYNPVGNDVCPNAVVEVFFDQLMSANGFNENFKVYESMTSACPTASQVRAKDLLGKIVSIFDQLIKKVLAAPAGQSTNWCEVKGKVTLYNSYLDENNQKVAATRATFILNSRFKNNTQYQVRLAENSSSIKSAAGGVLAPFSWQFTIIPQGICQINNIEVVPGSRTFTNITDDGTEVFQAIARAKNGEEVAAVIGIYDWSWKWSKIDPDNIIKITNSLTDQETATANNVNGGATLKAEAKITTDIINHTDKKVYVGYAEITNRLCLNPWPSSGDSYEDPSSYANFSLYYCRDYGNDGAEDDLPALKNPVIDNSPVDGNIKKEYLFLRDDDSTDAIGLRIFKNDEHLSPISWYAAQDFQSKGSPVNLLVDGYEAIKDGRSVYVSAANLSGGQLFTNIYLISYNENASETTKEIYNRLLKNWEFNINPEITDHRLCSDDNTYCTKDSDCVNDQKDKKCDALKTKLVRDTKRITDLGALKRNLQISYEVSNEDPALKHYPQLLSGSYEIGHSTSKWPSWTATFATELGASAPLDPLNEFNIKIENNPCTKSNEKIDCGLGTCSANIGHCMCGNNSDCTNSAYPQCYNNNCISVPVGYDPVSYWNQSTKKFVCPVGSHIYEYWSINNGTNFEIYANMEYDGDDKWINGDYGNYGCQNFLMTPSQ